MKLTDLTRKITSLQKAAQTRRNSDADDALKSWLQGYLNGLSDVADIIKREHEIERAELKLARLKTEHAQEPEPDWSQAPATTSADAPAAANSNRDKLPFIAVDANRQAA